MLKNVLSGENTNMEDIKNPIACQSAWFQESRAVQTYGLPMEPAATSVLESFLVGLAWP